MVRGERKPERRAQVIHSPVVGATDAAFGHTARVPPTASACRGWSWQLDREVRAGSSAWKTRVKPRQHGGTGAVNASIASAAGQDA